MALNSKKGIFYTIISISLMGLIIYAFSIGFTPKMQQKSYAASSVVNAMDNFYEDITKDMERAAHICAFRAILSLEQYIFESGKYVGEETPAIEESFEELFMNGTLDGTPYFLMENNTFQNWTQKMISQANDLYIVMNYSIIDFQLYQDDPWSIKTNINLSIDLKDRLGVARFDRKIFVTGVVDIDDFDDPFYTIKTSQDYIVKFRRTPYRAQFVLNGTNATNLELHANGSYYVASPSAPSFLQRFENDLTASDNGIESLINPKVQPYLVVGRCGYSTPKTNFYNRSIVDYIYCTSQNNLSYKNYTVTGLPSWLIIDNRSIIYNSTYN
ncbi:hypothetical protein COV93_01215, partial [Candidatus Woesearchaeota archaeon CG11_big_fil_rev_8_21_14_0_20_43_8]